jgi:hypothetical protein
MSGAPRRSLAGAFAPAPRSAGLLEALPPARHLHSADPDPATVDTRRKTGTEAGTGGGAAGEQTPPAPTTTAVTTTPDAPVTTPDAPVTTPDAPVTTPDAPVTTAAVRARTASSPTPSRDRGLPDPQAPEGPTGSASAQPREAARPTPAEERSTAIAGNRGGGAETPADAAVSAWATAPPVTRDTAGGSAQPADRTTPATEAATVVTGTPAHHTVGRRSADDVVRSVAVYLPPGLLTRLKRTAGEQQVTYAEILVRAAQAHVHTVAARFIPATPPPAGPGAMPTRATPPRGTGGIQTQVRLDGHQIAWLDLTVRQTGAPSRSALVVALLDVELSAH